MAVGFNTQTSEKIFGNPDPAQVPHEGRWGRPMKMNLSDEWCLKMADREAERDQVESASYEPAAGDAMTQKAELLADRIEKAVVVSLIEPMNDGAMLPVSFNPLSSSEVRSVINALRSQAASASVDREAISRKKIEETLRNHPTLISVCVDLNSDLPRVAKDLTDAIASLIAASATNSAPTADRDSSGSSQQHRVELEHVGDGAWQLVPKSMTDEMRYAMGIVRVTMCESFDDALDKQWAGAIAAAPQPTTPPPTPLRELHSSLTDNQINHMVDRFLNWRLPENFNPDGGISFKKAYNEHTSYPMKHEPVGTNLFSFNQADAMVRHMIDGMPEALAAYEGVAK